MALLTIREAAHRLGTDEKTVQEWIERGLLRPRYPCLPTAAQQTASGISHFTVHHA